MPEHIKDIYIAVLRWEARISIQAVGSNVYALYFFPAQGVPNKFLGPSGCSQDDMRYTYNQFLAWRSRRIFR